MHRNVSNYPVDLYYYRFAPMLINCSIPFINFSLLLLCTRHYAEPRLHLTYTMPQDEAHIPSCRDRAKLHVAGFKIDMSTGFVRSPAGRSYVYW